MDDGLVWVGLNVEDEEPLGLVEPICQIIDIYVLPQEWKLGVSLPSDLTKDYLVHCTERATHAMRVDHYDAPRDQNVSFTRWTCGEHLMKMGSFVAQQGSGGVSAVPLVPTSDFEAWLAQANKVNEGLK